MDDYGNAIRVMTVEAGKLAKVFGDGSSAPIGLTALAAYDQAHYYQGNGQDEEDMTWAVAQAGSGPEVCKGIHDIRHAAQVEKEVWCVLQSLTEVTQTQGAEIALLKARMLALETENEGLRTNIVNMEHRCTCTHNGGGL